MSRVSKWVLIGCALGSVVACAASGDDAASVFARYKDSSGGTHWDSVQTLRMTGSLAAGGLEGEFSTVQDLPRARSASSYRIGPIEGAEGNDGTRAWRRDPGGEVAQLDAPDAQRRARSQAWLDARGYWFPQRIGARQGPVQTRTVDGRPQTRIEVTPDGGDPLVLWFDFDSGLLARSEQQVGQDRVTTTFSDWRDVDGLRLPFRMASESIDASGRIDPRRSNEVRIERIEIGVAVSDADFAMPAMSATARIDSAQGITRIPFDLVNNHIYVDAEVDGKRVRMLVDTGGVNLLTPAAATRLGLVSEGKLAARGVGEQDVDLAMAPATNVRVGAAVLDNPVFYVIDLGELPNVEGIDFDGLVGYEMFSRFGVTIDYAARVLTLAQPGQFVAPQGAEAIDFELAERIPVIRGVLDGKPARLSVDTGSRVSLTLHSPFVRANDLVTRYAANPESVQGWGVGGPSRTRATRFGTLKLGALEIHGVAGDLFTADTGAFASPDVDGNLGGGVLRRFTVAFDYSARRMYLAPNADLDRPDAFDRSGLFFLRDRAGLRIVDAAAASAGQRAGLRADDVIVAIDGEPVTGRSLDAWRQHLRDVETGKPVAMSVLRSGKPIQVRLMPAERIPLRYAGGGPDRATKPEASAGD